MIAMEDATPLEKREELIIPYTAIVENGTVTQSAYPDAIPYLQDWEKKYGKNPLSGEALTALEEALAPYLTAHGYVRDAEDVGATYVTLAYDGGIFDAPTAPVRLQGNEWFAYENTTDFYPDYTDQIAYVTLHEGKIVSVAGENPNGNQTFAELYLETHPDFQGNGLAAQNARALIAELAKAGKRILYRCRADHAASLHLAKKLHFVEIDRFYCHNAYRIDE